MLCLDVDIFKNEPALEKLGNQCAFMSGRNKGQSHAPTAGGPLSGPDPSDPCAKTKDCYECEGQCGWCKQEVKQGVLNKVGGGWCSSECITTKGECASVSGSH